MALAILLAYIPGMSNVDEELKKALDESVPEGDATGAVAATIEESGDHSKRNLGLLIGLLVAGGAILSLVLGGSSDTMVYAKDVNTVLSTWSELGERNLRIQGVLVHGSLVKRDDPCEFRFKMQNKEGAQQGELDVRYGSCIVPDTFRDVKGMPVEVTAEGTLADGYLQAKHIFAKCPSKYEMQERQQSGEKAPHTLPGAGESPGAPSALPEDATSLPNSY